MMSNFLMQELTSISTLSSPSWTTSGVAFLCLCFLPSVQHSNFQEGNNKMPQEPKLTLVPVYFSRELSVKDILSTLLWPGPASRGAKKCTQEEVPILKQNKTPAETKTTQHTLQHCLQPTNPSQASQWLTLGWPGLVSLHLVLKELHPVLETLLDRGWRGTRLGRLKSKGGDLSNSLSSKH